MELNTEDKEQVILKSSLFGGFDKRCVLSYIDKLKEENKINVVDLEGSMEEMENASNELKMQIGSFEVKISDLENQLSQKSGKISELIGKVDSLEVKVKESDSVYEEAKQDLKEQKEKNQRLNLKIKTFEYKANRYDEMSGKLGEILISARENADKIIKKADSRAVEIKQDAVDSSNKIAQEMRGLKTDISDMRGSLKKLTESFTNRLNDVENEIDNVLNIDVLKSCYDSSEGEDENIDMIEEADVSQKVDIAEKVDIDNLIDKSNNKKGIFAVSKLQPKEEAGEVFFRGAAKTAK